MSYQKVKINPKVISIVLRPKSIAPFSSILPNLNTWCSRRKITVQFLAEEEKRLTKIFKSLPKNIQLVEKKDIHKKADLIISLGGDGTLLGTARQSTTQSPPILGVNMGRLGFITEFSRAELYDQLDAIIRTKVLFSKTNLFKTTVTRKGKKVFEGHFLNDAVVSKNEISRMFSLTLESDGEYIYDISGDGLIVSSPIGSTAYSLAAGGPIIHPFVSGLTLTPVCPHSLTHRPLIIPDKSNVQITVPGNNVSDLTLTLDGQEYFKLENRDLVEIKRSSTRYVKLIHNPERTYFLNLKDKFTHGKRDI